MSEDNRQDNQQTEPQNQNPPEPPTNWHPGAQNGPQQDFRFQLNAEFDSARKFVTASQVCAIISLFIGGIILSTIAVVLAYVGFRKYSALQQAGHIDDRSFALVKRSCVIAGVMAAAALVLNVIAFMAVYPLVMEYVQTGDMSVLFGGSGSGASGAGAAGGAGSGSSTWG